MLVMKFGGTSLADAQQVHKVLEIVRSRDARHPVAAEGGQDPTEDLAAIAAEPRPEAPGRGPRLELPDTSPPAITLALLAMGATWLLYRLGPRCFPGTGFEPAWDLLLSCMWIGKVEAFMFAWGTLMLASKAMLCLGQSRALRRAMFPSSFAGSRRITPDDVDGCLSHLRTLSRRPRRSILLNRVWLALEHLHQTGSVQEVR